MTIEHQFSVEDPSTEFALKDADPMFYLYMTFEHKYSVEDLATDFAL